MRCVATLFQRLNSVTVKNVLRRALARQVRANKTRIFCIPNISERTNKLFWRSVDDKSLMGDLVPSSDAAGSADGCGLCQMSACCWESLCFENDTEKKHWPCWNMTCHRTGGDGGEAVRKSYSRVFVALDIGTLKSVTRET